MTLQESRELLRGMDDDKLFTGQGAPILSTQVGVWEPFTGLVRRGLVAAAERLGFPPHVAVATDSRIKMLRCDYWLHV